MIYLRSLGVLLAIGVQFGGGAAESVIRTPQDGGNFSIAATVSVTAGSDLVLVRSAAESVADTWAPAGSIAAYRQFLGTIQHLNLPARTAVKVASLAGPGLLVEIGAVAA